MDYAGYNKEAGNFLIGDIITVTGFGSDNGKVEKVAPIGPDRSLDTANDKSARFNVDKLICIYQNL